MAGAKGRSRLPDWADRAGERRPDGEEGEFGRLDETSDTRPIEVSLVLSIIEHIDPGRFEHYKGNEIALVHEVLTIIGANTTRAYSYSKSSAGARGLFQLVPDTYRRLQEKYRSAGLTRDFASGCNDHTNAAKASLLLFDSDLSILPENGWPGGRMAGPSACTWPRRTIAAPRGLRNPPANAKANGHAVCRRKRESTSRNLTLSGT